MPRRGNVPKREVLPDPMYNSVLVTKLVNSVMLDGKKGVAQKVVYSAFDMIKDKTGNEPLDVFNQAMENIMPSLETKSRRVGGATYQVPMEVRPARRQTLGLRWLTAYARARGADRMSSYGDFVALSDTCDAATATLIKREVSDGVIAPDFTPEALDILKAKRKGTYNVIKIDPTYRPAPIEHKQVFGVTFEQGRNEVNLSDPALFANIPTQNKTFTPEAMRDLIVSLITLKYTQSNSVCYVKDGQAIGIGAGQQSRIHCTRLAGNKADIWWLRQHPKVMNLPFIDGIRRADRDNTIDVYISEDHDDVLRDGTWQLFFKEKPEVLTLEEKKAWIAQNTGVALGSDAFFPFGDNIERAHKSGVQYIAQAGGSVRDDNVIDTCNKYGIAMAFTGVRLFHH